MTVGENREQGFLPNDYPQDSYRVNSDGDYTGSWWSTDEHFDLEEEFYGTDPQDEDDYPYNIYEDDSDYDGVCDEEEKFYGTDPDDWSSSPDN